MAMGIATWPMVELEADDALASAAYMAAQDPEVEKLCIWTPDKDLAQCVSGARVVQVDRRSGQIRDDAGVRAKFGVAPSHIADYLALVGDTADGYPGVPKIGAKTAARLITRYGAINQFPSHVLGDHMKLALLFKQLATLRTDALLFTDVEALRWRGATDAFTCAAEQIGAPALMTRIAKLTPRP